MRLYQSALDHPVFSDAGLWRLFTWCLLKANFKAGTFMGKRIARGSFATGRIAAASELGEHPSTIYKRWEKLAELGCISLKSNNQFTTITICNYESYQDRTIQKEQRSNSEVTAKEQPSNNEVTTDGQRSNTIVEEQEEEKNKKNKSKRAARPPFTPPTLEEVSAYCQERQNTVQPQAFIDHYQARGWKYNGGLAMKDWQAAVRTWEKNSFDRSTAKQSQPDNPFFGTRT